MESKQETIKIADHVEHIRKLIDNAFRNRLGRMGIIANQISDIKMNHDRLDVILILTTSA